MTKFSTSGFVHPVTGCDVRGKDEKEQSVRERVRERERGTTETRVVFERDGEKEDEKSFQHHHFKNSNARRDDRLPKTNAYHHHNKRALL